MRLHFTSEKRPANLAKQLRTFLELEGFTTSMSVCREALACAAGYRNWNELIKVVRNEPPPIEAFNTSLQTDFERDFAHRLASRLDIPASKALEALDAIQPFEARRLSYLTDDHIRLMASNICSAGFLIEDTSDEAFLGFSMTRKISADDAGHPQTTTGREYKRYSLYVSRDGRIVSDENPPARNRSYYGPDDFTEIMSFAGLLDLPVNPSGIARGFPAIGIVEKTLACLDRQALLLMRCAGSFDQWAYMDALRIPATAPLLSLMVEYPGLATLFTELSRFDDLTGKKPRVSGTAFWSGVLSPDPVGVFADAVDQKLRKLWPPLAVSRQRVRAVTEKFLSIHPRDQYAVAASTAAFMCHLPDDIAPASARDMGHMADFFDRHSHVFGPDGMCVLPTTFPDAFRSRVGADWSKVRSLSSIRHFPLYPTIAAVTLGVAGREIGYDVSASNFEDASGPGDEVMYEIGHLLSKEAAMQFIDVADGYRKLEASSKPYDVQMEMDDSEFILEEEREFRLYRSLGFLHRKHADRSATDILRTLGYDIHEVIGMFQTSPGRLPATAIQS